MCGDYKVTLNPTLKVDQYPLPKPQDFFASLAGGQKFTKNRFSQCMSTDESQRRMSTSCSHQHTLWVIPVHVYTFQSGFITSHFSEGQGHYSSGDPECLFVI